METLTRKIAVLLALLVVATQAQPQQNSLPSQPQASSTNSGGGADEQAEHELERMLNQVRKENGLKPLAFDDRLARAAREHSRLMVEQHLLSHGLKGEPTLPNRMAATGIRFDQSGENLALNPTVEGAHNGLMHSPPHRANILSAQYNAVGIGVVRSGGNLWITQDFVHRLPFHTAEEAEKIIAREFDALRKGQGLPRLQRKPSARLRNLACQMARAGDLNAKRTLGTMEGFSVAFNAAEPDQLPQSLRRMAAQRGISSYSMGVCFAASEKYPSGAYWMAMVFQ